MTIRKRSSNSGHGLRRCRSIVTILLWIYYASLILLFGAEFTKAYAESRGSRKCLPNGPEQHRWARHAI